MGGFKSESVAGFALECVANFIGIRGQVVAAGEFGALVAHLEQQIVHQRFAQRLANSPAFIGRFAVDGALDLEQRIDAAHDFNRNRRERDFLFPGGFSTCVFIESCHRKARTPGVNPACYLDDSSGIAVGHTELGISVEGISLEDPAIPDQMAPRMLAFAIFGIETRIGLIKIYKEVPVLLARLTNPL